MFQVIGGYDKNASTYIVGFQNASIVVGLGSEDNFGEINFSE